MWKVDFGLYKSSVGSCLLKIIPATSGRDQRQEAGLTVWKEKRRGVGIKPRLTRKNKQFLNTES